MTTETKHTPTPWQRTGFTVFYQPNPGGRKMFICDVSQDAGNSVSPANAAFIVEACNSYATLRAENERLKAELNAPTPGVDGWCELAVSADFSAVLDLAKSIERQLTRLKAQGDSLREALNEIASFDDYVANHHLADTGSYCSFDEPVSVRRARAALAAIEKEGN